MRLTQWTDYTLRVLMYCAACEGRAHPVTITEVAEAHGISRSHLTKIVTTRGRGGGMRLMRPAHEISLGEVVRLSEADFDIVECFNPALNQCRMSQRCRLQNALMQATEAFLSVLDGQTVADLVASLPGSGCGMVAASGEPRSVPVRWVPGLPLPARNTP